MTVRVKICGLTREEDVLDCVRAGADLIGFNFWPQSRRYLSPALASPLRALVPDGVEAVGVFVNAPPEEVAQVARDLSLSAVQLHGDEDLAEYGGIGCELIPVLRVDPARPELAALPSRSARRVLVDAAVAGYGGAGKSFDWQLFAPFRERLDAELLLAGGLTVHNVLEAVRTLRPWGVDVASGVEQAPGIKDPELVRAFVAAARESAG
jgi:phosphoribosylanthranilate isomerase